MPSFVIITFVTLSLSDQRSSVATVIFAFCLIILSPRSLASSPAMPPLTIVYYVSGHGFGHATRVVEVTR